MIDDGKTEALVILAEECSEVIQEVAKIHRWGPNKFYGNGTTNLQQLVIELADVQAIIDIVVDQLQINPAVISTGVQKKKDKLKIYSKFLQIY